MHGLPGGGPYDGLRASDADRNRAIDVLKAGFLEGRLTQQELAWRESRVLAARTYGELAALTADLPAGPLGTISQPPPPPPSYYQYPVPYPRPPVVPARNTNAMAVASLVSSLVPLLGIGSVTAIVTGHVALEQIRKTGETGRGMAIAGLVIGYLGLVVIVLMVVAGLVSGN